MGETLFAIDCFPTVQTFWSESAFVDAIGSTASNSDNFAIFDTYVEPTSVAIWRWSVAMVISQFRIARTCIKHMHSVPICRAPRHRHDRLSWAIGARMASLDPKYLQLSPESSLWGRSLRYPY